MSVLKPGPVYVGTLLSEMGEDVQEIRVKDSAAGSTHIYHGNWQAHIPVYILSKEVRSFIAGDNPDGDGRMLLIGV